MIAVPSWCLRQREPKPNQLLSRPSRLERAERGAGFTIRSSWSTDDSVDIFSRPKFKVEYEILLTSVLRVVVVVPIDSVHPLEDVPPVLDRAIDPEIVEDEGEEGDDSRDEEAGVVLVVEDVVLVQPQRGRHDDALKHIIGYLLRP